ncbi:MAG: hypothetical protein AB1505_10935 [Candidatus Latescibacterota bacterium]
MTAARLRLTADGDSLRVTGPAGALTPALREQLRERKPALLALLREPAAYDDVRAASTTLGAGADEAAAQSAAPTWEDCGIFWEAAPLPGPDACPCCGRSAWWRKPTGERMCGTCHPDPSRQEAQVAAP